MVAAPEDTQPRGWMPTRGIPPAARTEATPDSLKKGAKEFGGRVPKDQRPPSPRAHQNAGSTRIHGGAKERSAKEGLQSNRTHRHSRGGTSSTQLGMPLLPSQRAPFYRPHCPCCADFKTETERSFQTPENYDPVEDEYGRPVRRLFSGRIKKRVRMPPFATAAI